MDRTYRNVSIKKEVAQDIERIRIHYALRSRAEVIEHLVLKQITKLGEPKWEATEKTRNAHYNG